MRKLNENFVKEEYPSTKPVILVDMDNTLFNFNACIEEPDKRGPKEMWVPGFFAKLTPIEGSHEAIMELMKFCDVWICTKPLAMSPISYTEKVESIAKHFPILLDKIIMCQNKGMIKGDVLIDDEQKNLNDFDGEGLYFSINGDHKKQWKWIVNHIRRRYA